MERTPINPVTWSEQFGYHQGELVTGAQRTLYVAGQTATDENGAPQHPGDIGAQLALAVQNVEDVLAGAGMTLSNVVRLKVYTTDVEALMPAYGTLAARLGQARVSPPNTLVEVSRLAVPGLLVELEVTAAD